MDLQRPRLLLVDEEGPTLALAADVARAEGFDVAMATDMADALAQLRRRPADVVVVLAADETAGQAVEGMLGAVDRIRKPLEAGLLRHLLTGLRRERERRRAVLGLERELAQRLEFCGMIGRGPAMQDVFGLIRRLAPHARTVLITGEAGTGKDLAARALHALGPRSSKRIITLTASSVLDKTLVDAADGATLYVDDVCALSPGTQAALCGVLGIGDELSAGPTPTRPIDVHVIAGSSRDLSAEVAAGRVRSDLYDRLTRVDVALPPLRDRREDIPLLTAAFVHAFAQRFRKPLIGPTPGAERMLAHAPWEGNVRQLRNVLERACLRAGGEYITESDLTGIMGEERVSIAVRTIPEADPSIARPVVAVERDDIVRTLQRVRGNKAVAARLLGISRRAFYRQLERHGLHQRIPAPSVPPDAARL
jgi:two-component system response regulator HydG